MSAPIPEQVHKVARDRPAPTNFPALDGVRGIAILAVVAFHVAVIGSTNAGWAYRSAPPLHTWPLFAGSLGVDVFFVLSGLLVFRSWQTLRERYRSEGIRSIVEFARRRGRRILPPYWFALAILIPWRVPHWSESLAGWRNIAMFASLNQFLDTDLPGKLSTVTWSLTTETHFYVALPLLALAMSRYGWRTMLTVLIVTSVSWRLLYGGTGAEAEWIVGRIDQFAAGIGAAALIADYQRGKPSRLLEVLTGRRAGWALGGALAVLAAAHGGLRLLPKPLVFRTFLHPIAGLLIAGLLVRIVCTGRMSILRNRALAWLGLLSYSLYLWHWPVIAEATGRWGRTPTVITAAVGVALAASIVSYVFLERPFLGKRVSNAQPEPGTREATMANSPWAVSSASVRAVPLGNRT